MEECITLTVWLVHLSWETLMHEFIPIKIVSCFPSFEANLCLRNNQDGYRSKSISKGRCCPCFIAYPKQCIEWCKENNLLSFSMSKTCLERSQLAKTKCIGRWICFTMLKKKLQWIDNLQSARTHNFLTVDFPWKNISPSYHLWPESLQLPTRQGLTLSHS